jgi:hypothetical protein
MKPHSHPDVFNLSYLFLGVDAWGLKNGDIPYYNVTYFPYDVKENVEEETITNLKKENLDKIPCFISSSTIKRLGENWDGE